MSLFTRPLLWLIRLYQRFLSPLLPRRCRYYPTCSAYAYEALKKHGLLKGFYLALWRLLRCNPFSPGGYDPVPERFVFFPKPPEPEDDDEDDPDTPSAAGEPDKNP